MILHLVVLFLWFLSYRPQGAFKFHRVSKVLSERIHEVKKHHGKEYYGLLRAMILGQKSGVSKELRDAYKTLGIIHLMTPSGLHYASLFSFFHLFLKKKHFKILQLLLGLFLFSLEGFFAIKRVVIFKTLSPIFKDTQLIFIMTFIFDMIFGGFLSSPASYLLSLGFWGCILWSPKNLRSLAINLFFTQILFNNLFGQSTSILSLFLNIPLTFLGTLLFPLLFLAYITNVSYIHSLTKICVLGFNSLVESCYQLSTIIPNIPNHLAISLIIIFYVFIRRPLVLLIFMSLVSYDLNPLEKIKPINQKTIYSLPVNCQVNDCKNEKIICVLDLKNDIWTADCRKKKRMAQRPF